MLSMTEDLKASDILNIRMLKLGIVYGLEGMSNDRLVVKLEPATTADQFKQLGKAIKVFDPLSKARALSGHEREELRQYCKNRHEMLGYFKGINGFSRQEEDALKACDFILEDLKSGHTFIKMQYQSLIDIQSALNLAVAEQGRDKGPLKRFLEVLSAKNGLERLGHVVAADAFNGNLDRFVYEGPSVTRKFGPYEMSFLAIINPGNIFLSTSGGSSTLALLDYADPSSAFRDFTQPLSSCESRARVKWPVRHLLDAKGRRDFATKLVTDLERILRPKKTMFSMGHKLGRDAVDRLAFGIYEGLIDLHIALKRKLSHKTQTGMAERVLILSMHLR